LEWCKRKKQAKDLGRNNMVISGKKYEHLAEVRWSKYESVREFDPDKDLPDFNTVSTGNIPSGEGLSKRESLPARAAHMTKKGRVIVRTFPSHWG